MNTEPYKYVVAGTLAFSADFSIFYLCTEILQVHYLASNAIGYFTGLCVAYILNTRWVFSFRKYKNSGVEFLLFSVIVLLGLGLSEAIMSLLVEVLSTNYLHAKVVASFFVMLFNYTAKKHFLFKPATHTG